MKLLEIVTTHGQVENRGDAIEALENLERLGYIIRLSDDWSAVWIIGSKSVPGVGSAVGQIG